jgi:hypothetical protein
MVEDEKPRFSAQLNGLLSNAELDGLMAELGTHPLAAGELREVKEAVFVSLNQSRPKGMEYAFCLSSGGRMHFLFRKAGYPSS